MAAEPSVITLAGLAKQETGGTVKKINKINAIADLYLRAHEIIEQHGTPEMRSLMRLLLFQIGQELARQEAGS
ncbi:hypothetical protein FV219_02020 [Methylobacterium sp. WL122]|nr:hypothetical protein FV219_02020 [Methylobacterium sp. WL122]